MLPIFFHFVFFYKIYYFLILYDYDLPCLLFLCSLPTRIICRSARLCYFDKWCSLSSEKCITHTTRTEKSAQRRARRCAFNGEMNDPDLWLGKGKQQMQYLVLTKSASKYAFFCLSSCYRMWRQSCISCISLTCINYHC